MIALGLLFAPFACRTVVFVVAAAVVAPTLPPLTGRTTRICGHRTAAIRTRLVRVVLLGLRALAFWAESEAVLPVCIVGMALAGAPPMTTSGSGACAPSP